MTTIAAQADTWREAFDARQTAVRNHPLYPHLFIKTARYAVKFYTRNPISYHYRGDRGRDSCLIDNEYGNPQIWYLRWSQTIITHDPRSYPQRAPRFAMMEIAEKIEADVYTDEERARGGSHGDRLASVWCTALDDVQMRVDGRKR